MGFDRKIQLFVSSTFMDMKRERDLLHDLVFPKVKAHCKTLGIDFHPIDLRWGIQEEASNHHPPPSSCDLSGKRHQGFWRHVPTKAPAPDWTARRLVATASVA